ncbi:MAG: hemerythrin domain-containing protein [Bacteroidota bacterium]
MTATDVLRAEHEGIKSMLAVLGELARRADAGGLILSDTRQVLEFFREFADRCHHGKEERQLFPTLESAGVAREGGPIGAMLAEHDQGRAAAKAMADALARLSRGRESAYGDFARAAREYISILTAHIAKEDGVLFPLAERVLPVWVQERLARAFDKIEAEEMGLGTHERYHAMIDLLGGKYLAQAGHVCG